jgi:hypothetical protein
MACRSGCPDQNHATWGECARSAHVAVQWLGGTGPSFSEEKRFSRENAAYRDAVKDGLNPEGVSFAAVNKAYENASKG